MRILEIYMIFNPQIQWVGYIIHYKMITINFHFYLLICADLFCNLIESFVYLISIFCYIKYIIRRFLIIMISIVFINLLVTSCIILTACHTEPKFQAPIDPYGLPYRVGSLDGYPVNLGQGFSYLEYDDEDIWKKKSFWERFQPRKQRDYQSVIASFGFDFRYPDNLLLTGYYK